MRTQAVVIEVEMLERNVRGEESDERRVGVDAEGIIAKVDGMQIGVVEDGCEEAG